MGGHCIKVDPYYLNHKSNKIGYKTRVINAGRNVNNRHAQICLLKNINETYELIENQKIEKKLF